MTTLLDPRAIGDACLCLAVRRAARAVARRYDDALRPVGLSNGQFSILVALSAGRRRNLAALAAELAMDRTTLTAALKPLLRDGLAELALDEGDHRLRLPRLTGAGRARLAEALPLWERAQAETAGSRPSSDLARLRADLLGLAPKG